IVPGATDKSYGVHVARLAGVPDIVTRRADEILKDIERESIMEPISKNKKVKKSPRYTQLIFFDHSEAKENMPVPSYHPILEEISSLDVDALTPREALNRLAEYQKRLFNDQDKNLG
ncbi:MAG: DNA mismatch repair protein MutS, partial [Methanotrichaceae archaeon]|nr:DNA mismatch repair protein MutS [Methanotrichaceae archaeon]